MKKAVIIGAGLAGLSAGIHLARAGFGVEVFEQAPWAGGVCTAWRRGGYRFDGCIHWMVGLKPGDGFYKMYREVDAVLADTPMHFDDELIQELDGAVYRIPMEPEALHAFFKGLAPADAREIDLLCDGLKKCARQHSAFPLVESPAGLFKAVADMPGYMAMGRHVGETVEEYAARFQSPVIRGLLRGLMAPGFSASALFMMLGTRMGKNAGYPLGGAEDVINRMVNALESAGGKLRLKTPVQEILVENGRAAGVRVGGEEVRADIVIAACDMDTVLNGLLKGKYPHPQLTGMLRAAPLFDPLAVVSFGVKKRMAIPYAAVYGCAVSTSPATAAQGFSLRSFDFDPSAAPEGKSSVMVMLEAPLAYWQDLRREDPEGYRREKARLAADVAAEIEKRFPGFTDEIEVTDVATPATYVRLNSLYKASFEGFTPTPAGLRAKIESTVPGVANLLLAGQWMSPGGGICTAVYSGRQAAKRAKKERG